MPGRCQAIQANARQQNDAQLSTNSRKSVKMKKKAVVAKGTKQNCFNNSRSLSLPKSIIHTLYINVQRISTSGLAKNTNTLCRIESTELKELLYKFFYKRASSEIILTQREYDYKLLFCRETSFIY